MFTISQAHGTIYPDSQDFDIVIWYYITWYNVSRTHTYHYLSDSVHVIFEI